MFCLSPFNSYPTFVLWRKIAIELKNWGFRGVSDSLMYWHINETLKRFLLASYCVVWAIMRVFAMHSSAGMLFRENYKRIKYLKKKFTACIFYMCVGCTPPIQLIGIGGRTFVTVLNVMNHDNFYSCMWRGLVYAKGRFSAFPMVSYNIPYARVNFWNFT